MGATGGPHFSLGAAPWPPVEPPLVGWGVKLYSLTRPLSNRCRQILTHRKAESASE